MTTLNKQEFEMAQKIIDGLDLERRSPKTEDLIDSKKIESFESFVNLYMKEQGLSVPEDSVQKMTDMVLSQKTPNSSIPLDQVWEEEQKDFHYEFVNPFSKENELNSLFFANIIVSLMICFALVFLSAITISAGHISILEKSLILFFSFLPLGCIGQNSIKDSIKQYRFIKKVRNSPRSVKYDFLRDFMLKKNKYELKESENFLSKVRILYPSDEVIVDFEYLKIKSLIASSDSKFQNILEKWKQTGQPIARYDFFMLCKKFNLIS